MLYNSLEGIFWSKWLLKFINMFFFMGKKFLFEKVLYISFFLLKKKLSSCPIFIFFEVLEKIKPMVGLKLYILKKRKIERMTAIPYIINISLQYKKAIFWLVNSIKIRKEKVLYKKLYYEFYNIIVNNTSDSFLKKKEFYKYVLLFKINKKFKW